MHCLPVSYAVCRALGAGENVLELAELLGAPVVTSQDAKGFVREDHVQVGGVLGIWQYVRSAAKSLFVLEISGGKTLGSIA